MSDTERVRLAVVLLLAACGRLGFETGSDGAIGGDDGVPGDALGDGPFNSPDAADIISTFGENTSNDFRNVTRDTFISMQDAAANFGTADNVRIERDQGARGLLRFDVSAIGVTRHILAARLAVYLEDATAGAAISFHKVMEAWDEGNVDGTNGVANYTFRQGLVPWSLIGAFPPASIGPEVGSFAGTAVGLVEVPFPVALVEAWVGNPSTNFGVLLESNSDQTVRIVSSEGADGMRPVLSVTYE